MLPIGTLLLLSAVARLLGLDSTGALQVMLSRPLVVGGIFGCLMGDTATGLAAGSLVEMLCMAGVPVGSLVVPDGPAAAVALGVLAAVPAGAVGARAEVVQRVLTNRLSRRADAVLDAGKLPSLA